MAGVLSAAVDSRAMWAETLSNLAPAAVAIVVPWLAFRYASQQDRQRWSRELRAQVYIDLLVEVSAERDWLARQLTLAEGLTPEDLSPFQDHRLNDLDRRRLGARVLAYGSKEVIRRHNAISYMGFWALTEMRDPAQRHEAKVSNDLAAAALEAQIRFELEAEHGGPRWRRPPVAPDDYEPTRRAQHARRMARGEQMLQRAWGMPADEEQSPEADEPEQDPGQPERGPK
jgi:hypothetical protein